MGPAPTPSRIKEQRMAPTLEVVPGFTSPLALITRIQEFRATTMNTFRTRKTYSAITTTMNRDFLLHQVAPYVSVRSRPSGHRRGRTPCSISGDDFDRVHLERQWTLPL